MPIEELTIEEAARDWRAFDDVIDVRSPSEFAEDHIPGALNLPVLDDEERARVGAIYVQESAFLARKTGAALVAQNVARHLKGPLAAKPGGYGPLVHCWRGGQRSRGMAIILEQIGWRVRTLKGGYKAYRRRVTDRLYDAEPWFPVVLLDGPTGVGKTKLLARLADRGAATLDLEALACHRGSIFGAEPGTAQPSQKLFETRILAAMETAFAAAAPGAPLILEAESSRIGQRQTPPMLWKAMQRAPAIRLEAPLPARARFCVETYRDVIAEPTRLDELIGRLAPLVGHAQVAQWRALAASGAYLRLAEELMARHYDPAYARSGKHDRRRIGAVRLSDLTDAEFDRAADAVMALARPLAA